MSLSDTPSMNPILGFFAIFLKAFINQPSLSPDLVAVSLI